MSPCPTESVMDRTGDLPGTCADFGYPQLSGLCIYFDFWMYQEAQVILP